MWYLPDRKMIQIMRGHDDDVEVCDNDSISFPALEMHVLKSTLNMCM